jgi:GntR family transcriptional regulator
MIRQSRSLLAMEETSRVISAQIVKPQLYVQELFGIEPGDQVVRREFIAGRGQSRTLYGVTFYSAELAALVPDLLNTAPGRNGGLLAKVLDATGRVITHARDDMHARAANRVEANHLGLPVGAPILAGVHRWSDADGLIEYGEWCIPTGIVVGYEYNPRA